MRVLQVVDRMNSLDWTEGVRIFQARVAESTADACRTQTIGGKCYPEIDSSSYQEELAPFGNSTPRLKPEDQPHADALVLPCFPTAVRTHQCTVVRPPDPRARVVGWNWTHPSEPLARPFKAHSAVELGAADWGLSSANPASFRRYPSDGFASFVIPFLSETHLPEQRGDASTVADFRLTRATRSNTRTPNYFCVRLSWDGQHIHQICDPNDPTTGRTTGVVRAAVLEFWNDLCVRRPRSFRPRRSRDPPLGLCCC